jgi:hypothetical protein
LSRLLWTIMMATTAAPWAPCASTPPSIQATLPATTTEDGDDESDAFLQRALTDIDEKSHAIKDLKSDFRQSKHTALLKKPLHSKGTLRIQARDDGSSVMRWDTTEPHPSSTWMSSEELRIYWPQQSLLEIYPIEKGWSQLSASPLPRLKLLREQFTISRWNWEGADPSHAEKQIALRLVPKQEEVLNHVLEVRILLDREIVCVIAAEVLYPDDDRLELRFTNIRLNSGMDEKELDLKVPTGTRISRPLDPKPAEG